MASLLYLAEGIDKDEVSDAPSSNVVAIPMFFMVVSNLAVSAL